MKKRLRELKKLTQMALDCELAELRRIAAEEAKSVTQLSALETSCSERYEQLEKKGGADTALYAGADTHWENWTQKEKIALNIQRSALLARREIQRGKAQKAFGKDQAMQKLLDNAVNKTLRLS